MGRILIVLALFNISIPNSQGIVLQSLMLKFKLLYDVYIVALCKYYHHDL